MLDIDDDEGTFEFSPKAKFTLPNNSHWCTITALWTTATVLKHAETLSIHMALNQLLLETECMRSC